MEIQSRNILISVERILKDFMENLRMIWFIKLKGCRCSGMKERINSKRNSINKYKEYLIEEFNCNDRVITITFLLQYVNVMMVLVSC